MDATSGLAWNRTGRVACVRHAPTMGGDRWQLEDWRVMTQNEIDSLPSASLDPEHPESPFCDECRERERGSGAPADF